MAPAVCTLHEAYTVWGGETSQRGEGQWPFMCGGPRTHVKAETDAAVAAAPRTRSLSQGPLVGPLSAYRCRRGVGMATHVLICTRISLGPFNRG